MNRRFFLQQLLRVAIGAVAAPAIVPVVAKIIQPAPYWTETCGTRVFSEDYFKAMEELFRVRGDTWRQMDIMTDRLTAEHIRNAFFNYYKTKV